MVSLEVVRLRWEKEVVFHRKGDRLVVSGQFGCGQFFVVGKGVSRNDAKAQSVVWMNGKQCTYYFCKEDIQRVEHTQINVFFLLSERY